MKALKITLIIVASLMLIGTGGYLYASNSIKSKPGYAKLIAPKDNALLSINVGHSGLGPVRWLLEQTLEKSDHGHKMPKQLLKAVMQDLQGVQLRVYDVGSNRHAFDSAITDSVAALKQKNWQTLMTLRDGDEQVVILQYGDNGKIDGLSIMGSTPDNAIFLNLIGPFDPDEIVETTSLVH